MNTFICDNLSADGGRLCFAGVPVSDLAQTYGTPLYLMDEDRIRNRCRTYTDACRRAFGDRFRILYASKAASFKEIYRIIASEGLGADVVSVGEIATARAAGFPMERAVFHSCNKTDEDIRFALDAGVGTFVIDNEEELFALEEILAARGQRQDVLIRLTPGIDPHTFAAVATGNVDSKFGFGIATGLAEDILAKALSLSHITLRGFHCHMGSQIFDPAVFFDAADIMLDFLALARDKYAFTAGELDLGGGIGVRYLPEQTAPDIAAIIESLGRHLVDRCAALDLPLPRIGFEPGRSLVADAGLTVYSVGSVKTVPGFRTYVSVDGGMTDNIRYALYRAPYTLLAADKLAEPCDMPCTVVGRCCESGDMIQENVPLPSSLSRGDFLAVLTTGAYNYSMASNYNRIARPPIVMLAGGEARIAVKRESLEDLLRLDE